VLCDGSAYDPTAHTDLFQAIGYTFGGSGSVFNVPNIPAPIANTKWVIVT
jgi:microcystin-dependent protein